MTSHELAKHLLSRPDMDVYTIDRDGDYHGHIAIGEETIWYEPGYPQYGKDYKRSKYYQEKQGLVIY